MAYLIHFNKNHSSKDGRFVSGDGDGDGISNDHARRTSSPIKVKGAKVSDVYKTKKGKEVVYVSPDSIFKKGYWADNKTGKRLVGRTLFRSAAKEMQGREFAKSLFMQSAGDIQQNERAMRYAKQYKLDLIDWS